MTKDIDVLMKNYNDNQSLLDYYIEEKNKCRNEIDIEWYNNEISKIKSQQMIIEKRINK